MNRFFSAFVFAWNGLKVAISEENNLKIHLCGALIATGGAYYYNVTSGEWLAIILVVALVILTELINTAIERLVDLISPERNSLAGKIKDIGAGAVLVSAVAALLTALIIFPKYIFSV